MAQTIQAYRRRKRGWKHPFSWFEWFMQNRGNTLFRYDTASGRNTGAETFTRASTATYVDATGTVQTAASGIKRDRHYINGQGPYLLLEGSRTNAAFHSGDFTNAEYTKTGGAAAKDVVGPDGVANSATTFTSSATTAYIEHSRGAATAGSVQSLSGTIKAGTSAFVRVGDIGDAAVHVAWINPNTGVVGTQTNCTCTTGPLGNGWYWYRLTWTATNSYTITPRHLLASADAVSTCVNPSTGLFGTVQIEANAIYPSSYIPTTTAAVTRSADALSFAFTPVPQAMTVYADLIDLGTGLVNGLRVFQIGTNAGARLLLRGDGTVSPYLQFNNGAATQVTGSITLWAVNSRVEPLATLATDGATTLGFSVDGAAQSNATAGTAQALPSVWGESVLYIGIGEAASGPGFAAFRSVKVAPGVKSLAQMRSL